MQKRQLNSEFIEFESPQGERKPGVRPTKYKVVVLPDVLKKQTSGGIELPQNRVDKEENGQTEGELVAVAGKAFYDWDEGERPKVGQRIVFEAYAGQFFTGVDGLKYRLMNDDQIVGVRE